MAITVEELATDHKIRLISGKQYLSNIIDKQQVSRPGVESEIMPGSAQTVTQLEVCRMISVPFVVAGNSYIIKKVANDARNKLPKTIQPAR